eukprot:m.34769 g.34769  ORF g.34769 m.34769 type:complete len:489 (-) comp14324_c0_seq5:363-1829(-)
MDKLKGWVEKKRTDSRFKKAGQGRSLGTSESAKADGGAAAKNIGGAQQSGSTAERRQPPKESAAASAALARLEKQNKGGAVVPRVFAGTKGATAAEIEKDEELRRLKMQANAMSKARQERERKQQQQLSSDATSQNLTESSAKSATGTQISFKFRCSVLEVMRSLGVISDGALAECCCGASGGLYEQMDIDGQILRCLRMVLLHNPLHISAALIHTSCQDETQRDVCINTMLKYITNIAKNPQEEKYRRIRLSNDAFQNRVASVDGALDFLRAAGFCDEESDGQSFLVMAEDAAVALALSVEDIQAALVGGKTVKGLFDHNVCIVPPSTAADSMVGVVLPDSFFVQSKEDIRKQAALLSDAVNEQLSLRTQAMRNEKKLAARKAYRYALVRVRFPSEGPLLQAVFRVSDTVETVCKVVSDALDPLTPFVLQTIPDRTPLSDATQTVVDAGLAPKSTIAIVFTEDGATSRPRTTLPTHQTRPLQRSAFL